LFGQESTVPAGQLRSSDSVALTVTLRQSDSNQQSD